MASSARIRTVLGLIVLGLFLGGCVTDGTALPDVSCKVFHPITWSKKDTKPTIRQIIAHNAGYISLCPQ